MGKAVSRPINKLSDKAVRAASRSGRLSDGGGLYLSITRTEAKSWVFMWSRKDITGKVKRTELGLGAYPAVSLAAARKRAEEFRTHVAEGRDPKNERDREGEPTFKKAVEKYLEAMAPQWSNEKHRYQWGQTLGPSYCGPILQTPVSQIGMADVLKVLKPVWSEKPETASRLRGRIERVLNYCKVSGWRDGENPALWRGNLENVLPKKPKLTRGHQAAMQYHLVPAFMAELRERDALAARALELLTLTVGRTGEVLGAKWPEIDLDAGLWTVPPLRMKLRKEHRIPLTDYAKRILKELHEVRVSEFVFPGRDPRKPLSNMSMMMLLRRMGYGDLTVHGFRSSFRDWAGDETSFAREVAEQCLAHQVGDQTERAYRRSDALEKRRALLSAWADYCGGPAADNVVELHG